MRVRGGRAGARSFAFVKHALESAAREPSKFTRRPGIYASLQAVRELRRRLGRKRIAS